MFDHPQVRAMGFMREYNNPEAGTYQGLGRWALFGDERHADPNSRSDAGAAPETVNGGAPGLGQHTRQILRELGYADEGIEALIASAAAR
jgi:crotonobetainyl-CoA:carnitine CoA-transferase CaiB-like acyl-CoA transferase